MPFAVDSLMYNDFDFNDNTQFVSTKVRALPIYDDANRMVKYIEYTIDVKGFFAATSSGQLLQTDTQMEALRQILQDPGNKLHCDNRGYGAFTINDPARSEVWDCNWGPKPGKFTYQPLGMGYGCMFEWSVTTCIPECLGAVYQKALMMACYEVDYEIVDGLTTITTKGAIEIPLTFRTNLRLADNVDAYREMCFPQVLPGFQRKPEKFSVSKDRKRGEFSYVDQELPVALPNGCTMADIKHRVRNKVPKALRSWWINDISGTIRTNPAIPKITALDRFMLIVMNRFLIATRVLGGGPVQLPNQQAGAQPAQVNNPAAQGVLNLLGLGVNALPIPAGARQPTRIYINTFEMTENIFTLDSQFGIQYEMSVPQGLAHVVKASGLWQPIPTDFTTWRDSVANNAHHPRGTARMSFANEADTLVDLCSPGRTQQLPTRWPNTPENPGRPDPREAEFQTVPEFLAPILDTGMPDGRQALSRRVLGGGPPDPEFSWISYSAFLLYNEDDNIAIHKPLSGTVKTSPSTVDPFGTSNADVLSQLTNTTNISCDTPDIVQRLNSPSIRVTFMGVAERLGYTIDPPRMEKFQGKDVKQMFATIKKGVVNEIGGIPVFMVAWVITYVVITPPDSLPVLMNPMYNVTANN